MKKIFSFALILLSSSILYWSCSKDGSGLTDDLELNGSSNLASSFSLNYATFEDEPAFREFLKSYIALSAQEQVNLYKSFTYKTMRTYLDEIYAGMETLETREDFVKYLQPYAHLLQLVTLENGEESVETKRDADLFLNCFLNADGIVKVGSEFRKYIGDYYAVSTNYNDLKQIRTEKDLLASKIEYVKYGDATFLAKNDLSKIKEWEYENDRRFCLNDRKIIFEAYYTVSPITYDVVPAFKVTNRRKGIPCIWYTAPSDVSWNNFLMVHTVDNGGGVISTTNTEADFNVFNVSDYTVLGLSNEPINANSTVYWKRIRSSVSNTGIGTQYLNIDETY